MSAVNEYSTTSVGTLSWVSTTGGSASEVGYTGYHNLGISSDNMTPGHVTYVLLQSCQIKIHPFGMWAESGKVTRFAR